MQQEENSGICNRYNLQAEQSVIGSMLIDPESSLKATDIIGAEDFYSEKYQHIFKAVLDLYQLGEHIDAMSVSDRVKHNGGSAPVSFIADTMALVPTSANIISHSNIVKNKSVTRRIESWLNEKQAQLKNRNGDPLSDFLAEMESGVLDIAQQVREKQSPNISDILHELKQRWARVKEGKEHVVSAMPSMADSIPGYYPGHVWMIGGYTSSGKSTLLAQMVIDALRDGGKVLIFSTEDKREDKAIKLVANLSDVSQKLLITGKIAGYEDRIEHAREWLRDKPVVIYDDVYTIEEMRLKAKKHKLRAGLDIIALDFVQNIKGKGGIYERMSDAATDIQSMAKELSCTFWVLSQVNNDSMKDQGSEVIGLKGAGELAAVADIILWLKRHKQKGREHWLDSEIRKNRPFGVTGVIGMEYSKYWTKIEKRLNDEN